MIHTTEKINYLIFYRHNDLIIEIYYFMSHKNCFIDYSVNIFAENIFPGIKWWSPYLVIVPLTNYTICALQ